MAAYETAHSELATGTSKYAGWVEFVADTDVELVSDEPDTAVFPHGTINRPVGLRLNKSSRKWAASIRVAGESVHLGTFVNGSDAAGVRVEAEKLVAEGKDASGIREALNLPEPGQRFSHRRNKGARGFFRAKTGSWVARVTRKGKVHELGGWQRGVRVWCGVVCVM